MPRLMPVCLLGVALLGLAPAVLHAAIYVSSIGDDTIGKYNLDGTPIDAAFISNSQAAVGMAFSDDGADLFAASINLNAVSKYNAATGDTVNAQFISGLSQPFDVAVHGSDLYVINRDVGRIGHYTTSGATVNASLITGLFDPRGVAVSDDGSTLFVVNVGLGVVGHYDAATGAPLNAALISGFASPFGIAVSGANLFVVDSDTNSVGKYTTSGATVDSSFITGLNGVRFIALSGDGLDLYVTNIAGGTVGQYDAVTGAAVNAALITGLSSPFGIEISIEELLGDFDGDLDVDLSDYLNLSSHLLTDVSGMTAEQTYLLGDMNADLKIDGRDFLDFRTAFEDANGVGAFVALLSAVPEPSTGPLLVLACAALSLRRVGARTHLFRLNLVNVPQAKEAE